MITLHTLSTADYRHLRYQALVGAEGLELAPYIDTNGWYTTGIGFLLSGATSPVRDSVYETLGFQPAGLTTAQKLIEQGYINELTTIFNQNYIGRPKFDPGTQAAIEDVMHRRFIDIRLSFPKREFFWFDLATDAQGDNIEAKNALNGFVDQDHEQRLVQVKGLILPESRERAALLMQVYLNGNLVSKKFVGAFNAGNRAEAWYELRYNTWLLGQSEAGNVKRSIYASDLFGLYEGTSVNVDEAKSVYRMLQLHRKEIGNFWQQGSAKWSTTESALVSDANLTWTTNTTVKTLAGDLTSARDALFADLLTQYPTGMAGLAASDFNPVNVYLDPNRDPGQAVTVNNPNHIAFLNSAVDPVTGAEVNNRDILIGEGGDDYLMGGKGDDVLIGGKGMDTYYWRSGDGNDRIIDEDKQGIIVINNGAYDLYASGVFIKQGTSNIWKKITPDGELTLTHNSPWKIVTADGSQIELGDFQSGDFGLFLDDGPPTTTDTLTGTAADNYLDSTSAASRTVQGDAGRDLIWGSTQADVLDGGAGDDWIVGDHGADHIQAGDGNDYVSGVFEDSLVEGGAGDDILTANAADWVFIQGPNATIGADAFWKDAAAVFFTPGHLDGMIIGTDDYLTTQYWSGFRDGTFSGASSFGDGWTYQFTVSGGTWDASYTHPTLAPSGIAPASYWEHATQEQVLTAGVMLLGEAGSDLLIGNAANDYLDGGSERDFLFGNKGDDTLDGGTGDDLIAGGAGDDTLIGGDGADQLHGETGSDVIFGGGGDDSIWADSQSESLAALSGDDTVDGGAGNDQIMGQEGADTLLGNDGDDLVIGGAGADHLQGGAGADILHGDAHPSDPPLAAADQGDDFLEGGAGDDSLFGGGGMLATGGGSTLSGGRGADLLVGAGGNNVYLYDLGDGSDHLQDTGGQVDAGGNPMPNVLRFGEGIAPEDLSLGLGSLAIRVGSDPNDVIHIDNFNPNDVYGQRAIDRFEFAPSPGSGQAGTALTYEALLARGFDLAGTAGDDVIAGTNIADRIDGGTGNDTLAGGGGNDTLAGGGGNDTLIRGGGEDSALSDGRAAANDMEWKRAA